MIVELVCEQRARVDVDAPPDTSDKELTRLALEVLDRSGGAEWETELGWVERVYPRG